LRSNIFWAVTRLRALKGGLVRRLACWLGRLSSSDWGGIGFSLCCAGFAGDLGDFFSAGCGESLCA